MTERERRYLLQLCESDQQNHAHAYKDWLEETHQLAERLEREHNQVIPEK